MVQVIKNTDYEVMPWKNGKGITSQIVIYPPGATLSQQVFLWRISTATVVESGPFSQFPGFDRHLAILHGDGIILNDTLLRPKEVMHFKGEEHIIGSLTNQTVIDLGIIFRRDAVDATMKYIEVELGQSHQIYLTHELNFIFCVQGTFTVFDKFVQTGNCLKIQEESKLELLAGSERTLQLFLIGISLKN